jgi:beta-phosphoglucomutase
MTVGACIYDLEGIIIDTSKHHFEAWKRLAIELGFDLSVDQNEQLKSAGKTNSIDLLLEMGGVKLNDKEKLAALNRKNIWYLGFIQKITHDEILPGVYGFLLELKTNHIKLALGSSNANAKMILQRLEIYRLFDSVIVGDKGAKAKPDPDILLRVSEELRVKSAECMAFENTRLGIESAHQAGMLCVGIGSPQDLNTADLVIPGFDTIEWNDILNMLNH